MALLESRDPFAPIRTLSFKKYRNEVAGLSDQEAGAMAQDQVYEGWTLGGTDGPEQEWTSLKDSGFQSKYNDATEVDPVNYPGLMKVTLQNPAQGKNHKYDTLEAFYLVNPDTGEGTLVQEPVETRQVSSRESFKDIMEGKILPAAILMVAGGYAAGAMTGASATTAGTAAGTTAAAGTTTMGLTSAQWAAAQAAALKGAGWGAAVSGGTTLARGGSVSDAFKAAAKGALVGGVTGGVGSAGSSALGLGSTGQAALSGGLRAAVGGGDAGDIATGALTGGVTAGANDYMKTDLGWDPSARAAVTGAGRTLLSGGDGKDALLSAGTGYLGGYGKTDSATSGGSQGGSTTMSTYDDIDWGETIDYSQFGGSDAAIDPYGPGSGWGGDTLTNMGATNDTNAGAGDYLAGAGKWVASLFGASGGKVSVGGVDFGGGDLLKLFAAGIGGMQQGAANDKALAQREAEYVRNRQNQLEDRDFNVGRQDQLRTEDRTNDLTDRSSLWGREDDIREESRGNYEADRDLLWGREDKLRTDNRGLFEADRDLLWGREDSEDDENRGQYLDDRTHTEGRSDAQRAEERKWSLEERAYAEELAARLLREKFERMRPASITAPRLVKTGGR